MLPALTLLAALTLLPARLLTRLTCLGAFLALALLAAGLAFLTVLCALLLSFLPRLLTLTLIALLIPAAGRLRATLQLIDLLANALCLSQCLLHRNFALIITAQALVARS